MYKRIVEKLNFCRSFMESLRVFFQLPIYQKPGEEICLFLSFFVFACKIFSRARSGFGLLFFYKRLCFSFFGIFHRELLLVVVEKGILIEGFVKGQGRLILALSEKDYKKSFQQEPDKMAIKNGAS